MTEFPCKEHERRSKPASLPLPEITWRIGQINLLPVTNFGRLFLTTTCRFSNLVHREQQRCDSGWFTFKENNSWNSKWSWYWCQRWRPNFNVFDSGGKKIWKSAYCHMIIKEACRDSRWREEFSLHSSEPLNLHWIFPLWKGSVWLSETFSWEGLWLTTEVPRAIFFLFKLSLSQLSLPFSFSLSLFLLHPYLKQVFISLFFF